MEADAQRGRVLLEESRELVVVLDEDDGVVAASQRAREAIEGLREGPPGTGRARRRERPRRSSSPTRQPAAASASSTSAPGDLPAYEELRAGFTAAVSHELRTPLARLLALLETALLPGEDPSRSSRRRATRSSRSGELIDDVLFLSELETGARSSRSGATRVLRCSSRWSADLDEQAARAGVGSSSRAIRGRGGGAAAHAASVAQNLAENAIRYAGQGATLTLSVGREDGVSSARPTTAWASTRDLPRLFERFFRADRARASRGTGLGLAIVKHVVTAGGRHRGGTRRPRPRARDPLRFPA